MSKETLIIATHNEHKVEEIKAMLPPSFQTQFDLASCNSLLPKLTWEETGLSFEENAMIKLRSIQSKMPHAHILADDSGLCVPSLGGQPGIYSSRFAGDQASDQDNMRKLLNLMESFEGEQRAAYFQCTLCYQAPKGEVQFFEGRVHGRISDTPSGSKGFGYDPIFIPEDFQKSLAELEPAIKNEISHRFNAVKSWLNSLTV
jgi:XTP/dITP diphosphohydrolase